MAVSIFVMGQKLSQFASGDVEVDVDVQVVYITVEMAQNFLASRSILMMMVMVNQMFWLI